MGSIDHSNGSANNITNEGGIPNIRPDTSPMGIAENSKINSFAVTYLNPKTRTTATTGLGVGIINDELLTH